MDLKEVFAKIKSGDVKFIDLKFVDLRGVWQHVTLSSALFDKESIENGFGFDGSSIRGFSEIFESDLLLRPDVSTCFLDPFFDSTVSVICNVVHPDTNENFVKDPRNVALLAEEYLKKSKIADISYWGPELEFFLFDRLDYKVEKYKSGYTIDSADLHGSSLSDGYPVRAKAGYIPVPPIDKLQNFRNEAVSILENLGIEVECHHHEVATAGQCEIDLKYDSLVKMADKVMIYKYVVKNLARQYDMVATFLPKPIYGDNGSGMHTHQSLFKNGKNVFYDKDGYAELSEQALYYISGVLSNLNPLLAITNSTVNSYRRLVPGYEAPTTVAFSKRNRSAAIRIPTYQTGHEKSKRIELRCPDPLANPYLAFSAMLVFGIDGIEREIQPEKLNFGPFEENLWEKAKVGHTPDNLGAVLESLGKDKLLENSKVFSKEILESYIALKKEEVQEHNLYPSPADFYLYNDI